MSQSKAALRREVLRLLKARHRAAPEDVTKLNRELAHAFVALREHFVDGEGNADWRGRSYQYRTFVGDLLTDAGYDREQSKSAMAAMRYHLGEALRSKLDDDELARIGLLPESPRERSSQRRESRMSVVRALTNADRQGGLLVALNAIIRILSLLPKDAFAGMTAGERELAEQMLAEVRAELNRLARGIRQTGGPLDA